MAFFIEKISLTQFRNYTASRLTCQNGSIVLIGPNGAGKTNILEAISLLSPGRGLRRAKGERLKNTRARGMEYWAISADLNTPSGQVKIGTGQRHDKDTRVIRINGVDQSSQGALAEISAIVWLTPQMDGLFLDSPSARRRFLDRMVANFNPKHTTHTNTYTKLLRERAQLLKKQKSNADPVWLNSLEGQIANTGVIIAAARKVFCEQLEKAIARLNMDEDGFPKPAISVSGSIDEHLLNHPAIETEDYFRTALRASREADSFIGGAKEGTHKSDFTVLHKTLNMPAENCSTGEQKGLLLNLILAEASLIKAERGFAPLLLLDDISAFIDEKRRHVLFEAITRLGCQCWMSGTDKQDFDALKNTAQFLSISNGKISEYNAV